MMDCRRSTSAGLLGRWAMVVGLTAGMAIAAQAAPVITGFNVAQAPMGSNLIIYGADLGTVQGTGYVLYGDAMLPAVAWDANAIYALVLPQGGTATPVPGTALPVKVVRADGQQSNEVMFTLEALQAGTTTGTTTGSTTGTTTTGSTTGSTTGTTTGSTTGTTTSEATVNQILNNALLIERIAARFYATNINKAYLTGSTTGTTTGSTTGTTTTGTTTGTTTTGTTTTGSTGGTTGETTGTTTGSTTGTTGGTNTTTTGTTTGTTTTGTTTGGTTATGNLSALQSIVSEIKSDHDAHVTLLESMLGTNASAVPTFQDANLDAPTITQFLTMAQMFEDAAASVHQGLIDVAFQTVSSTTGSTTGTTATSAVSTVDAMALNDARHAGGVRVYRKVVSAAEGGDASIRLSDDGALNVARTSEQLNSFIQPYVTGVTVTTPGGATSGGTTTGSTTGTTTTGSTTTGGTTGSTTGTTTTGGTTGATVP